MNDWADLEAGRRANAAQPLSRAVKIQYLDRVVAQVIHHLAQRVQAALDHTDKDLVKKTIAKRRQQAREQAASPAAGPNKKQRMQAKVDSPPEVEGHQWEVKEFKTNFTMKCKICQLYIESCKTGEVFERLLRQPCIGFETEVLTWPDLHPSHTMINKGCVWQCGGCGRQARPSALTLGSNPHSKKLVAPCPAQEESSSSSSAAQAPAKAPRPKAQGRHTPTQVLREQSGKEWWSSSKITRSKTRPDKAQREENRRQEEQRRLQSEWEWNEWYHSTPQGSGASSSSAYPWTGWNWSTDWEAYDWSSWSWWEQPASSPAEPPAPSGDGEASSWTSQRPRPRSPPRPRRGDESRPKSAGISLSENPTWLKRSATPERAEPSAPLRLRPNVKTEIEDEIHAAAAEIAAGDPIEVSDEENDWNQVEAEPLTGPQPSKRPESEIPALWGMARPNRRRPTEDHHYLPPRLTAYRTSAGVLLRQPVTLQSLNKGQSRIVYSISSAIVMKITSRLQEHGEEHSFSLQFSAFCDEGTGAPYLENGASIQRPDNSASVPGTIPRARVQAHAVAGTLGQFTGGYCQDWFGVLLVRPPGQHPFVESTAARLRQHESGRQIVRSTCLRTGPLRLGIVDKGIWRPSCTHQPQSDVRVAGKGLGSLVPRALTGVP